MAKHKCYRSELKTKVPLGTIREEMTTAELSKVRSTSDDDQRMETSGDCEYGAVI